MDPGTLIFLALIALLFVPIILNGRRQKRAIADAQALQASLEVGDVVVTTSGLRGTVVDASYEETIDLEIADGVVTTWVRPAIREKIVVVDAAAETTDAEPPADADADTSSPRP